MNIIGFFIKIALLNRDQTDEWKGWAQLMILLYHYIGGSKVQILYIFLRFLFSEDYVGACVSKGAFQCHTIV